MWVLREKAKRGPSEKVAICKPRREASGETKLADTLILDLNYEKKKTKKDLLFEPLSLYCFTLAAQQMNTDKNMVVVV